MPTRRARSPRRRSWRPRNGGAGREGNGAGAGVDGEGTTGAVAAVLGQPNVVPKLRTSTRGDIEQSEKNNQRRIKDWHNRELEIIWNMDLETRTMVLSSWDL